MTKVSEKTLWIFYVQKRKRIFQDNKTGKMILLFTWPLYTCPENSSALFTTNICSGIMNEKGMRKDSLSAQ